MIKSVYNGTGVMEEAILENLTRNIEMTAAGFCKEKYTAREMDIIKAVAKEKLSHRTALAVYYLTGKKQG